MLTGFVLSSIVFFYIILWISLSINELNTHKEAVIKYKGYFPKELESPIKSTFIFIILCIISYFCFKIIKKSSNTRFLKISSSIMMPLLILITIWLIFTLM